MYERYVGDGFKRGFSIEHSDEIQFACSKGKSNAGIFNGKEHMETFYALQDKYSENQRHFPHSKAIRHLRSTDKCGMRDPILHLEKFSEAFFIRLA